MTLNEFLDFLIYREYEFDPVKNQYEALSRRDIVDLYGDKVIEIADVDLTCHKGYHPINSVNLYGNRNIITIGYD